MDKTIDPIEGGSARPTSTAINGQRDKAGRYRANIWISKEKFI